MQSEQAADVFEKPSERTCLFAGTGVAGISDDWCTIFGQKRVSVGKWSWRVHIDSFWRISSLRQMVIGITVDKSSRKREPFSITSGWGYTNLGEKQCFSLPCSEEYGKAYNAGDVVEVCLDLDDFKLTFCLNGISQGEAHSQLPRSGLYSLAVSMCGKCAISLKRHSSEAISSLDGLLERYERLFHGSDKDISLELQDGKEWAHKSVLCAASKVFHKMFTHDLREARSSVISLPDVTVKSMRIFLRIIYTGQINPDDWKDDKSLLIPTQCLLDVAKLANKYMVEDVCDIAVQVLTKRLRAAQVSGDIESFQDILSASLPCGLNCVALSLAALDIARGFPMLKSKFHEGQLRPEIEFALEAIWLTPKPTRKRRWLE